MSHPVEDQFSRFTYNLEKEETQMPQFSYNIEDVWQTEDSIRSVAEAVTRLGVWELSYDRQIQCFRLELDGHLTEEQATDLCMQFYISADYQGEGTHGSRFMLRK